MSKSEGKNIGIKFTDDITTVDVSFNAPAFKVTGQEYQWVDGPDNNGPLIDKSYTVGSVERYAAEKISSIAGVPFALGEGFVENYGSNLCPGKTYSAISQYSSSWAINKPYNATGSWITLGTGVPAWTQIDYTDTKIIKKLELQNVEAERVKDFIFQGSNDGVSYTDIYTGAQLQNTLLQTHEFDNQNAYRYYRIYVTSQYASSRVGFTHIRQYETELVSGGYENQRTIVSSPLVHSGSGRIVWNEIVPIGTSVTIEYTTGAEQGEWAEVSNGDVITSDTNLWFRATLETTDTSITPTLQDLWIEEPDAPQDKIGIVFDDYSRFPSVVGDITVEYDASLGNLAGSGGAVESFIETFTPTELVPIFNPNAPDHLTIALNFALAVKEVEFESYKLDEPADQICILPPSMALTITHVGTLPL